VPASRRILAALLPLLLFAPSLRAQGVTDVIRGRVTDDSSHVVAAATVFVTRGPDRALKQTTSDSAGRYSVSFENGTGDYLVAVSATGFKAVRRRVQRLNDERVLVADFVLSADVAALAAVKVTAEKPVRATNTVSPFGSEPGVAEKWTDGVSGQVSPSLAGSISAIVGTMPGMTMGAGGASLLGASNESNLTTLNGMALAAGSLPRAARTETRVTGATFDPTRGGFAGANIDVRLSPGSRQYQQRNAFFTLDSPQLQYTDAVGRSLGARNGSYRGSAGADGEIIRKTLTYNVALDFARNTSDPATLLFGDEATFARAGVARDSVTRLLAAAQPLGLPLAGGGIPGTRQRDALTWLGRLDDTRDSLDTRTFTSYADFTREGALNFAPLSAPSAGGERRARTLGAQLQLGDYVGEGRRVLSQTRFAASQVHTETTPYVSLPGASVLVRSGANAGDGIAALTLGGSSFLANDDTRWTAEGANETIWNARGRRHTFKSLLWARGDGMQQSGGADLLGRYSFNSIADFSAGRATSYSRTLVQPERSGTVWNAAGAVAHQWAPSRWFSMLYGARVEANGFASAPARNPALESALGVATGAAPTLVHVSPRIGFQFTYNRERDNGNGTSQNQVGRFYRTTSGVLRGGIGEFRDLLRADLLADASSHTGLAGSAQSLSCVGAAVPTLDWRRFLADPNSLPTQCSDGSGPLAELAPPATLIDRSFDVPRSWRASLDWNTNVGPWLFRVSGLASYDLSQPGTVDANFGGVSRFALAGEGNRPVFVSTAAIDGASGAVSATESRRSGAFGRVGVRTSDLRGYGGLVTFLVSPDVFKMRRVPFSPYVSVAYTLQRTRREFRGFDGAAFGDPRTREWAAGANDARHIVVIQGGMSHKYIGSLTLFARAQSGLPFTPVVQGDVNGDGRSGDRAFVPDANAATTDAALAAQLRALRAGGSPTAIRCIQDFAGRIVDRNGCRGPWTTSLNMQWRPPLPSSVAQRFTTTVYLDNALGGLDQLLHGVENVRGWGAAAMPDPVLLVPRGFDAASKSFRYDVNPRFAETRPSRTLARTPFRITIDFSLRLSTDFDLQQLRRALEPVRAAKGWQRRSADSLTAFYLANTSDIHQLMLSESDSLFLSNAQSAALRRTDSAYSARVRAIYVPLGQYLSQFADGVATKAALDSANATTKQYWKIFWEQPEIADSIITPTQRELMPMMKGILMVPKKDREHSQWMFGHPVKLRDQDKGSAAPKK
jgi:hypothetical protein